MTVRKLVFALACAAAVRAGAATPVPNTFTAGTPAKAAEVNANFTSLVSQIAALEARLEALVPTGAILPFTGATIPAGFLPCDGAAVSRTEYATLFGVLGVSFGEGDQITTFNVPDLRGRFLRGQDGASGRDPDRGTRTASAPGGKTGDNIGSLQGAAFAVHSHGITDPTHRHYLSGGGSCGCQPGGADLSVAYAASPHFSDYSATGISIQNAGGSSETRPVNVYVGYIIKI
ncbi:MAG TPA: tail fiber protein [Anaeromyxobacter sp.]|nr:tail fiber protein [Anaeromyxobacter sp.]